MAERKAFALITGATKGIGKAIAEKALEFGMDIAVCARTKADLEKVEKEWAKSYPKQHIHPFSVDMSKKEAVEAFGKAINELDQAVDLLVNNAGVFMPGKISEEPEGNLETMVNTNLYSAYYLTRALLPAMKKRQSGHIFNMCSTASITAYPNGGSYSISKFALLGMSKVLREELKEEGIRVTSILPGATLTASWEGVELPPERFMRPQDVADAVFNAYQMPKQTVVEELLMRPFEGDLG